MLLLLLTLSLPLEPPLPPAALAARHAQALASAKQAQPANGDEVGKDPLMPSPEREVTLVSWLMFGWVAPLMELAARRKLQYPDVWELPEASKAGAVYRSSLRLK